MRYFQQNSKGDVILDVVKTLFLALLVIITLYPFLNIVAISFNDSIDTLRGGIYLLPRKFSIASYEDILTNPDFVGSIRITVARTVVGTVLSVIVQSTLGYALSRKELVGRKAITLIFVFTMYFSGGLIPSYMVIRSLGLLNNFWVFVVPGLLSVYNMILIRSYIQTLPESMIESARLDGANDLIVYLRIIMPLIKPILLTVGLFVAVGQWNSWFDANLYVRSQELKPMQSILYEILKQYDSSSSFGQQMANASAGNAVTPDSVRMAGTIVTILPIILVYPLIQKHFIKGMLIGGVKD